MWTDDDLKIYDYAANTNDENIDPYELVRELINHHNKHIDGNIVDSFFNNVTGRFLVIGANNGIDHSKNLLENGWQGVYCDPDPFALTELIENTRLYKNQIQIINTAVLPENLGLQKFYLSINDSMYSSSLPDWASTHLSNNSQREILINSISFQSLIDLIGNDFDFISVDVEGIDIPLCESINWGQFYNLKLILLEAGPSVIKQLYAQGRFIMTDRTPTNAIYKKLSYKK
jgi:FkbM family methyltransferase